MHNNKNGEFIMVVDYDEATTPHQYKQDENGNPIKATRYIFQKRQIETASFR